MMKLVESSSTHSRPSFHLFSARPFLTFSISAHAFSINNSSSLSVCGFSRIFQSNKASINSLTFFTMSNAYVTRSHCVHHKKLLSTRRSGNVFCRTFSTCSVPAVSPAASLLVRPPASLVLTACVTQSDVPQLSEEWFALRKDKLTTSTFSTALGFWKGNRRFELWQEKVFQTEDQIVESSRRNAMEWGVLNEATAIDRYKSITGREVNSLGFAIHSEERLHWLGASPDGLLDCFPGGGLLEVKCPYNKGKPETCLPWSAMPFYYMPQVQGQLEIMDREWADLYCWTPNGSAIFRVCRERDYWKLIHEILREFWWENVIPAKEAVLLGREEEAKTYKPTSTHKRTGLAIFKSVKLARECKLLCREIAGHVEFFR